eukprot:gene28102-33934_t
MSALTSRLDAKLIEDAAKALIKYERKQEQERESRKLIEERPKWVLLQVQLQKEINQDVRKPVRVRIPHSLFSTDLEHSICLFIRDDQKERVETYLQSHPIAGLDKVLTLGEVRKLYKEFQNRKKLLSEHDFFLCHHSIGRQLYNLLGKDFGARHHFPIQITFPELDKLPKAVQQAVDSTYMHKAGRSMTVKVGLTHMSPQHIRENVIEGMEFAIQKLPKGWRDVHSLHMKTKDSASLPIFSATDNELLNYVKSKVQEKNEKKARTAVVAVDTPGQKLQKKRKDAPEAPAAKAATPKKKTKQT